jgi:hypothetical protein
MVSVTLEVREGPVSRRIRVTARSIERALAMAGDGEPGRTVSVVFPLDPETFFAPGATASATPDTPPLTVVA